LLLLALAGCAARPPLPPLPRPPEGAACYAALAAQGAAWRQAASPGARRGCVVADPIRLDASGRILWERPPLLACPLAAALGRFAEGALQPAALRELGQPVVRLHHLGAWDCRTRTGSLFRMSEHAGGRAIDLAAFELADGRRVAVKTDWENGRSGRFLRAVATAACGYFSVVLTPETDRHHQDHFHLDIGPHRVCD
jgi:hypothetical protein